MSGVQAASDFKFFSGYSKYIDDLGRKETWDESVQRVMDMHTIKYDDVMSHELSKLMDYAQERYTSKLVLGSQRALQFGGDPMLKKNARMFNCLSSYADRVDFFQETMYFLLCGCGVGFSVQNHHIKKLPQIQPRYQGVKTFVIPDSIEGWSDAFGVLISSYVTHDATFPEYQGYRVDFDYSLIRPKGSMISGGFKAPGPDGLRNSIQKVQDLLNRETVDGPVDMRSLVVYDIVMHLGDAVLSGGVRRCLPKGTKVFLRDGVKNIEDVGIGDQVLTPLGYHSVSNRFIQGNQKLVEIKTQDGSFKCTPNHKMPVMDGVGSYKWVQANEIQPQDRIITNTHPIEGTKTCLPVYNYVRPTGSTTCVDIKIPNLDTNVAWLLGLFQGDGYVNYNPNRNKSDNKSNNSFNIVFSMDQLDAAEKAKHQIERFGVRATLKKRKGENSYILRSVSKQLSEYFYKHIKQASTPLSIPDFIWNATTDIKLAFVAGLMDADGSAKTRPVQICTTVYEGYARDIQTLLYSCGITTRFKALTTVNLKAGWQPKFSISPINLIDKELITNIPELHKKLGSNKISRLGNSYPTRFIIDDDRFKGKLTKMGVFSSKNITIDCVGRHGVVNSLVPVEVLSVVDGGSDDTFDIEVEDAHQFYANGYLTHNSATLCLFSIEDDGMKNAKTGNWFDDNPQRGRSNNSCMVDRNSVTKDIIDSLVQSNKRGDFGLIISGNKNITFNPCSEISMYPQTEKGESGFQGCNLTEINGGACFSEKIFYEACKASAILGTLQAGYTDIGYVSKQTIEIFEREALLGCSITGWMNNPDVLFDPEILRKGARIVKKWNKIVADLIGINQAARTTCVKPSGNASVLLGCGSGIHGEHSKRYFRNAQVNKEDDCGGFYQELNPEAVEDSLWSANNTDWVISFPIEATDNTILKKDLYGVKQLEFVKIAQKNWVEEGTNIELCVCPEARHNVSNTIQVDDWEEVSKYIFENKDWIAGVSLISLEGDKDYVQAPFTEVLDETELLEKYGKASILASGLIVDALHAFGGDLWEACKYALNRSVEIKNEHDALLKRDWIRRCKQFADRYLDEDVQLATYCLKDVYIFHKWLKITRERVNVPWESLDLKPQFAYADTMSGAACAGGTCELPI